VREVVKGQRLQTVSDALHFTYAALRKWVHRFARQGVQGLTDRPRSGRPPKVTCALAHHLDRLVDQDPVQHGSSHSQWSCQELATVFARQTGIQLRHGAEIISRFISACIIASVPEHFSGRITHCLKHVAA
jgi:transposase